MYSSGIKNNNNNHNIISDSIDHISNLYFTLEYYSCFPAAAAAATSNVNDLMILESGLTITIECIAKRNQSEQFYPKEQQQHNLQRRCAMTS